MSEGLTAFRAACVSMSAFGGLMLVSMLLVTCDPGYEPMH